MIFINKVNLKTFLITIIDIGPKRLCGRFFFDIKKNIEFILPKKLLEIWFNYFFKIPIWKNEVYYSKIKILDNKSFLNIQKNAITFDFLNKKKSLKMPLVWEDKSSSKLWNFNLHYFDWAKFWLEDFIKIDNNNLENYYLINILIDQWIKNNPIGKGVGWNSYTTSLRIKNWVFIFRTCPNFLTKKRLQSLWMQICWLNSHKEDFLGGNHLLENLTALVIGSLQFDSENSKKINKNTLKILEKELDKQILNDGGHEERSASYHLLILDRLVEMGFHIQIHKNYKPDWLVEKIKLMVDWVLKIRLINGLYPRFNDCSFDPNYNLDSILSFAFSYLGNSYKPLRGYRLLLSESNITRIGFKNNLKEISYVNGLVDLPDTGWTILKPGGNWELIFKCGKVCPNHLPAHCHSDLLSFELFNNGIPFFSEFGTSTYDNNEIRKIERSGEAHNQFQLSHPINNFSKKNTKWVEPIEVWDSFRAGRKANIIERESGRNSKSQYWVLGSHDGFFRFGGFHKRYIEIDLLDNYSLSLKVEDFVETNQRMLWRQFWHLGPSIELEYFISIINQLKKQHNLKHEIKNTWYSKDFGERVQRKSLCVHGLLEPGKHFFKVNLLLNQIN